MPPGNCSRAGHRLCFLREDRVGGRRVLGELVLKHLGMLGDKTSRGESSLRCRDCVSSPSGLTVALLQPMNSRA